jgi:hypothetical protein
VLGNHRYGTSPSLQRLLLNSDEARVIQEDDGLVMFLFDSEEKEQMQNSLPPQGAQIR